MSIRKYLQQVLSDGQLLIANMRRSAQRIVAAPSGGHRRRSRGGCSASGTAESLFFAQAKMRPKINKKLSFSVSPFIGYTFILKEDKGLAKITEKNKRIKDIDVN